MSLPYREHQMCTVISKGCIWQCSEMLVYQHVKVIISEVKASLPSPRFYYMPTQLMWSYIYGLVILTKFYMPLTLYCAMPTNASFSYDCTQIQFRLTSSGNSRSKTRGPYWSISELHWSARSPNKLQICFRSFKISFCKLKQDWYLFEKRLFLCFFLFPSFLLYLFIFFILSFLFIFYFVILFIYFVIYLFIYLFIFIYFFFYIFLFCYFIYFFIYFVISLFFCNSISYTYLNCRIAKHHLGVIEESFTIHARVTSLKLHLNGKKER